MNQATDPAPMPRARTCPFDPSPEYDRLRSDDPVSRIALPGGGTGWLVSRLEDVRSVLTDDRFCVLGLAAPQIRVEEHELPEEPLPGALLRLNGAEHRRYRRPVIRSFTLKRVQTLRPRIQQIVDQQLDAMERAGGRADLVTDLALPVTSLVICELLGVPYEDRVTFQELTVRFLDVEAAPEQVQQARAELAFFIAGLVGEKRLQPGDDLLSALIAEADSNPESGLDDMALTVLGSLILVAGHETTANMTALAALALMEHPDQLAVLTADPSIADRAVEELLRHLTVVQFGLARMATEDVTLAGQLILAGEYVVAALPSANRDPRLGIERPDRLDITREPANHVAFGYGPHQCLGQQLARVEMQITLTSLFERFPGLRPALPLAGIPFNDDKIFYGPRSLPVTW